MINISNLKELFKDSKRYTKTYRRIYDLLGLRSYAFPDFTKYLEIKTAKLNFASEKTVIKQSVSDKPFLISYSAEPALTDDLYYVTSKRVFDKDSKKVILVSHNNKYLLIDGHYNRLIISTNVELTDKDIEFFKDNDAYVNNKTLFKDVEFLVYFGSTYYTSFENDTFFVNTKIKSVIFDKSPDVSDTECYVDISQRHCIGGPDDDLCMVEHTFTSLEKNVPDDKIQIVGENGLCIANEVLETITFLQVNDTDALTQIFMLLTI